MLTYVSLILFIFLIIGSYWLYMARLYLLSAFYGYVYVFALRVHTHVVISRSQYTGGGQRQFMESVGPGD